MSYELNPALALVNYIVEERPDEALVLMKLWHEGDFKSIRKEWPSAPESIYMGADPLYQKGDLFRLSFQEVVDSFNRHLNVKSTYDIKESSDVIRTPPKFNDDKEYADFLYGWTKCIEHLNHHLTIISEYINSKKTNGVDEYKVPKWIDPYTNNGDIRADTAFRCGWNECREAFIIQFNIN